MDTLGVSKLINISKNNIFDFPFHDSDLKNCEIKRNENGDTGLILQIQFMIEELDDEVLNEINSDGSASLKFENCNFINMNMHCNIDKFDELDNFQIIENSDIIMNLKLNGLHWIHSRLSFISGSEINCVSESIYITKLN